jgi:hypothetical protein
MDETNGTAGQDEQRGRYRTPQQPRSTVRHEPPATVPVDATGDERPLAPPPRVEERTVSEPTTVRRLPRTGGDRMVGRLVQIVDYMFYLLYALLGVRFVLGLLGAREDAGFVRLIERFTDPFYEPFTGIVARPPADGGVIDFPLVIAIFAYVVLHIAVRGMLRLFTSGSHRTTTRAP